mgnify:CR=1 FL=1
MSGLEIPSDQADADATRKSKTSVGKIKCVQFLGMGLIYFKLGKIQLL